MVLLATPSPNYFRPIPIHPASPTALEIDVFAGVVHPNIAEGNYGDPSDKIFLVYLAQTDKSDKGQSESSKGGTEGILTLYVVGPYL